MLDLPESSIPDRSCLASLAQSQFHCPVSAGQDVGDRVRDRVVGANTMGSLFGSVDRHVVADQLHRQNQPGVRKHHGSVGTRRVAVVPAGGFLTDECRAAAIVQHREEFARGGKASAIHENDHFPAEMRGSGLLDTPVGMAHHMILAVGPGLDHVGDVGRQRFPVGNILEEIEGQLVDDEVAVIPKWLVHQIRKKYPAELVFAAAVVSHVQNQPGKPLVADLGEDAFEENT